MRPCRNMQLTVVFTCDFYVHWTKLFKIQLSEGKKKERAVGEFSSFKNVPVDCNVKLKS